MNSAAFAPPGRRARNLEFGRVSPPAGPAGPAGAGRTNHQAIGRVSRKKPPVGPSGGRVAAQVMPEAPVSRERGAEGPPMSVRTQPGQTALIRMPRSERAGARMRTRALRPTFETL